MADTRGVEIRESSIRLSFAFNGKRERRTLMVDGAALPPTPANVKYAHRLIADIRLRIRAGTFSLAEYFPDNGTVARGGAVADQLDHWLSTQNIEESTKAGYSSAIKFWKPLIGQLAMTAVRHSDILKALRTRPDLNGKTVNNYVSVLRAAMQLAVLDQLLKDNPVAAIENAKWQKEPPDPFDREEVEKIVAYAQEHYDPAVANMIEFRFFTGVRTSEMVGLQWGSIDWNKRQMLVREAVVRGIRKQTKTNKARIVALNSRAFAALERHRDALPRANILTIPGAVSSPLPQKPSAPAADTTIFLDPRYGTPWVDERAFRRSFWTPALKALGIRYRPPNNSRHTFATMLLMAGATPAYAAKQMGHSVEMFLSVYSKWIDDGHGDLEQAKLERFIGQNSPATPLDQKKG
ncbi:Arm DNA-binding domain-containing protein [Comamonas odontotermitis]|uniref:Arm DNA-binding domain-containing protein n=1 Tax=Comamonas odontotermitis TaxID=379895 RepID=UPI0036711D5B